MKILINLGLALWLALLPASGWGAGETKLPAPSQKGTVSVEEALASRRSVRQYANKSLDLQQVSQLLWAADGINNPQGKRTAPAARAAYAIDLYLVVGDRGVTDLDPGVYHYVVADQALEPVLTGDQKAAVAKACNNQTWITQAPVLVVITGEYARAAAKNPEKLAPMFTHFEAGFVAQNIFLQAGALGLGAGIVGGFNPDTLTQTLKLPAGRVPLLVMPVGYKP